MIGRTLGPYAIEEEIGRGGMGTVYRAEHVDTHEPIAVKVLPPELARQGDFLARFQREIGMLEGLDHPHITRVDSFGQQDGIHYYGMEFVDGRSLDEILDGRGKLDWEQATEVVEQVASALKHAHDRGIVHRDVKPANVLVDIMWNVKLTDFGIAKTRDATQLTATGGVVGTVEYMSPEQADGRQVDKRTDLWSLGAVFYQMLTGRPPHVGRTATDVLRQVRLGVYEPVRNLSPDVPLSIVQIVDGLLVKDRSYRTGDASVLIGQIEAARRKISISASRPTAPLVDTTPTAAGPSPVGVGSPRTSRLRHVTALVRQTLRPKTFRSAGGRLRYLIRRWSVALACTLGLIVLGVTLSRPPTADALYRDGMTKMNLASARGLTVAQRSVLRREAHTIFERLAAEHPDFQWSVEGHVARREAARARREYREDLATAAGVSIGIVEDRLGRPVPLRGRRALGSHARRLLEQGLDLLKKGQAGEARRVLAALAEEYADDADARYWVQIATKKVGEIDAGADSVVRRRYEAALRLAEAGRGAEATETFERLVLLFEGAPEEAVWVEKARRAIRMLAARGTATRPSSASQPRAGRAAPASRRLSVQ